MVWVDRIEDTEAFSGGSPVWGCYGEPLLQPADLLLQAVPLNGCPTPFGHTLTYSVVITAYKPDGTVLGDVSTCFDWFVAVFTLNGVSTTYLNIRLDHYGSVMTANGCFILGVRATQLDMTSLTECILFTGFTQKYMTFGVPTLATGVTISGTTTTITLCGAPDPTGPCGSYVKFAGVFECIDEFTGDYYGDPQHILGGQGRYPFPFIRQSNIEGRLRKLPRSVKRTISINCRTQRSEKTDKWILDAVRPFPVWKMDELENMLLANHLYVDGTEYQSEGGAPFVQAGLPQRCVYYYKFNLPLQGCFEWQIFGCTPVCESQTYYYALP